MATGETRYRHSPVRDQAINGMAFDQRANALVCSTTIHADCQSRSPRSDRCSFAVLDADTLAVRRVRRAPKGVAAGQIAGRYNRRTWLCLCHDVGDRGTLWFAVTAADLRVPAAVDMTAYGETVWQRQPTAYPGILLGWKDGGALVLWDIRQDRELRVLWRGEAYRAFVDGDSVYVATAPEIVVLEDCPARLGGGRRRRRQR